MSKLMNTFGEANGPHTAAIGIDLGTTNSCVSIVRGNVPEIIELDDGKKLFPSCVMWKGQKGEYITGKEAYNNRFRPSAVYSVKRLMGTDETVTLKYGQKKVTLTPVEVSSIILKGIMEQVHKKYVGIKDVVITVPADFNNRQVQDTIEAGKLAGLNVIQTLREPTSAALNYYKDNVQKDTTILVWDMGGGTWDISLLSLKITKENEELENISELYGFDKEEVTDVLNAESDSSLVCTVLDMEGDTHLGGDDIDLALLDIVLEKIEKQTGLSRDSIPEVNKKEIVLRLERAKKLTSRDYYALKFSCRVDKKNYKTTVGIGSDEHREAAKRVYKRTRSRTKKLLERNSSLSIDGICLVGGTTKSPYIREFLESDFPGIQLDFALDPDESVALGAAIAAKNIKFGTSNVKIFDVIPANICIKVDDELVPVVRKNTQVPFNKGTMLKTSVPNQEAVKLRIYQSNSKLVEEGTFLSEVRITGFTPKEEQVPVYVNFKGDSNGLVVLEASVGEKRVKVEVAQLFGHNKSESVPVIEDRRLKTWRKLVDKLDKNKRGEFSVLLDKYESGDSSVSEVVEYIQESGLI